MSIVLGPALLALGVGPLCDVASAADNAPRAATNREVRAIWCASGVGAFPNNWEHLAELLAKCGYNTILPNMLWGGVADYASDVLPRSEHFQKSGDQLKQCCAAAKKHGLQVHVWAIDFNLGATSKEFAAKLSREGRLQVTSEGRPCDWLCPSHPDNRQLELNAMLEVARKYPIDGLHLDYIRYPGPECCYCDGCRRRFETDSGRKVADWPGDCATGRRKEEYNDWRCRQITALVASLSQEAKKIRPTLKVSAAVFIRYPKCRTNKAQDWPVWVKAGYLDFICPMNYTNNTEEFSTLVRDQQKLVGGRVPIYPGIGLRSSDSQLTPEQVTDQIRCARSLGTEGFTIFVLHPDTLQLLRPLPK